MKRPDPDYRPDNKLVEIGQRLLIAEDARMERLFPPLGEVPCNGCSQCCQQDAIFMKPEFGDDASQYETVQVPDAPEGMRMLARKPNGDCVYLDRAKGCTIHGQAPITCREFDCRALWLRRNDRQIREHIINAERILGKGKYGVVKRGGELHKRRHEFLEQRRRN